MTAPPLHAATHDMTALVGALFQTTWPRLTRELADAAGLDADRVRRMLTEALALGWVESTHGADPRAAAWRLTAWPAELGCGWDGFLRRGDGASAKLLERRARIPARWAGLAAEPVHAGARATLRLTEVLLTSDRWRPTAELGAPVGLSPDSARRQLHTLKGRGWAQLGEGPGPETWLAGPVLAAHASAWTGALAATCGELTTILARVRAA